MSNRIIDPRNVGSRREGVVYVGFTVNEDGQVADVVVKQSAMDKELDEVAVNAVKAMWTGEGKHIIPGKNALGKPIKVTYMLPITFSPREKIRRRDRKRK